MIVCLSTNIDYPVSPSVYQTFTGRGPAWIESPASHRLIPSVLRQPLTDAGLQARVEHKSSGARVDLRHALVAADGVLAGHVSAAARVQALVHV